MADEIDIRNALDSDDFVRETEKMRTALGLVALSGEELCASLRSQLQLIGADIETLAARQQQIAQTASGHGFASALREDQALITLLQANYQSLSNEVANLTRNMQEANSAIGDSKSLNRQVEGLGTFTSVVKGVSEGLQGVSGALGIARNTAALFGAESNQLAGILQKLQQVQGIVNGVEQVSNVLRKKSYVQTALMPAVTGAWTRAQTFLNVQLGLSAALSKGLMIGGIGLLIAGIGLLVYKLKDANKEWSAAAEVRKEVQAVSEEATQRTIGEVTALQDLERIASDVNKPLKDRNEAIGKLNALMPEYNGYIDAETGILQSNKQALVDYITALGKVEVVKELSKKNAEDTLKIIQNDQRKAGIQDGTITPKATHLVMGKYIGGQFGGTNFVTSEQEQKAAEANRNEEIRQLEKHNEKIKATIEERNKTIGKLMENAPSLYPSDLPGKKEVKTTAAPAVDLDRIMLDNTLKLEAERLALLEDGKTKRLALIEAERQQKKAALEREYQEQLRGYAARKQAVPEEVHETYRQRDNLIDQQAAKQTSAVEGNYAAQFAERERQLTAILSTEEEKRRAEIQERYDAMRRWTLEAEKNGDITPRQASAHMANIGKAQNKEELGDLVTKYQTREQQIQEIVAQSLEEQKRLRQQGYHDEAVQAARQLDKTVSSMTLEDDSFQKLFGGLDGMAVSEIDNLIAEIQDKLDSGQLQLNEVDTRKVVGGLNKAKQQIISVNPFKGLANSVQDIFKKGSDGAGESTQDIKNKWENLGKSTQGCFDFVNDAIAGCEVLGDTIGDSGKASMQLIQSVTMAGMGLSSAIQSAETASIVLAAISATLTVVGAMFSLFNDDKKHEKRIQALQAEINSLSYSYDRLGRSIQQTYFTNSEAEKNALKEQREAVKKQIAELERKNTFKLYNNEIKELKKELQDLDFKGDVYDQMDAQAENLQAQQAKIQQQIVEEQAKKKTDKGKIADWEKQIQDLKDKEKELERQRIEMLAGTDVKSAIDQFADALTDAYAKGEDGAKALGDTTKKILANAVKEALKKQLLAKGMEEAVNFLGNAMKDGVLSDEDQSEFERLTREAGEKYMAGMKAYDDLFKGDPAEEADKQAEGMRGEISEKITENTASKLEGLFRLGVDLQARLANVGSEQLTVAQSSLVQVADIGRSNIAIEENTRRTADNTDGLRERLDTVATELRAIKNNTTDKQLWQK